MPVSDGSESRWGILARAGVEPVATKSVSEAASVNRTVVEATAMPRSCRRRRVVVTILADRGPVHRQKVGQDAQRAGLPQVDQGGHDAVGIGEQGLDAGPGRSAAGASALLPVVLRGLGGLGGSDAFDQLGQFLAGHAGQHRGGEDPEVP
jgi:hypothetical protein